ncbi:hypothetical protein ACHGLA_00315 [Streptomyces sp. YH02]|uniref:hypothetical protein n=1 Tax=Streptomyces sp. YH02 TaxID=3256999 RepID=UPI0037566C23
MKTGETFPLLDHVTSLVPDSDSDSDDGLLAVGGTLAHSEGLYRIALDETTGKPAVILVRTAGLPTALTALKESLPPTGTFDFDRAGGTLKAGWTLSRFNARVSLTLTFNGAYTQTMKAEPANGIGPSIERKGSFTLTRAPRPHDFDGNGSPDVLARLWDGTLTSYDVRQVWNLDAYENPYELPIGGGWKAYDRILAVGNLGGTRDSDLVARDKDGVLWLYQGEGSYTAPSPRAPGSAAAGASTTSSPPDPTTPTTDATT